MTETVSQTTGRITRFVDIVFPGETNHHGTLFGDIGLAHMDRVAFIAAARHARIPGQLLRGRWYARQTRRGAPVTIKSSISPKIRSPTPCWVAIKLANGHPLRLPWSSRDYRIDRLTGRRYWPAVQAFLDRRHGVDAQIIPSQADGDKRWP